MRLVCPNCDAEYEVDGAAIPLSGRDVQCSNCGHAWFQTHPDLAEPAADEPAQAVAESPAGPAVAEAASQPEPPAAAPAPTGPAPKAAEATAAETTAAETTAAETKAAETTAAAPVPEPQPDPLADQAPAAPRNIDESVLAVLREEAEREALARKAEAKAPALETQTEMPLAPVAAIPRQGARPVATAAPIPEQPEAEAAAAETETVTRPRRDLFPAIEEVNSTLRATSDRAGDAASDEETLRAEAKAEAGGFGRGFLTLVLIGVILLALYVFAPLIGANVPALASTAQAYVAAVDAARLWLDGEIKTLVGWLRGLEGGTKG